MALREIRVDLNKPINVVEAFMGLDYFNSVIAGSVSKVIVDGRSVPFDYRVVTDKEIVKEAVLDGVFHRQVRGVASAEGLYGETLQLEWVYREYVDAVYQQPRPELSTVELHCVNWDELNFIPNELFAMVSAEFNEI